MDEITVESRLIGNKVISTLAVPRNLRKYIESYKLYVKYDAPISADTSIINIPLISNILPLAWLTGADVHVETLDKSYVEAMNAIKHEFNLIFPRGRFKSKIIVDNLVENHNQSKETALLFTGGIDSTYSMIDNIALKPRLIMYSGIQHYQLYQTYAKREQFVKETYSAFAKRQGLNFNFIKTNIIGILNDSRIAHDFYRILRGTNLWIGLQEPLVLLSLPAPLSIGRFNRLLIAASVDSTNDYIKYPCSSQPRIDEKFAWADLRVKHHGYINRFSKTSLIKEYMKNNKIDINVCNSPPLNLLNCSACEKCYRTITSLVLEGIDPNQCNFNVNELTFQSIKRLLLKKDAGFLLNGDLWTILQTLVPDEVKTDCYGSRDFFLWFKSIKIDKVLKKRDLYWTIYNYLPFPLALLLDALIYSIIRRLLRQRKWVVDPFSSFISLIRLSLARNK